MQSWWSRHEARQAERDAFMQHRADDHARRLDAGDEDALETTPDYVDLDGVPMRLEAGFALVLIVLVATVLPLIGLFWLIQSWLGR